MGKNIFNELKKNLKMQNKPEFTFNIYNEFEYDQTLLTKCNNYFIQNGVLNTNSIPFIFDIFGISQDINLSEVEKALMKYKEIDQPLFENQQLHTDFTGFKSASTINQSTMNKKMHESNTKTTENDLFKEKIKSDIIKSHMSISWNDIIGLNKVKQAIKEIIIWPMLRPDIFVGLRNPPKGLLLFGPPGTGKTMIGKCIAAQVNATFFSISASSLTSKWVGEGEKLVKALFEVAREMSPSIIFVDEIDSLLSQRQDNENDGSRKIKTEFLVQFDGAKVDDSQQILLIGATNRPHEIDEAARRRLVKRIYVPLPTEDERLEMIKQLISKYKNNIFNDPTNNDKLVQLTEGYSGSDIFNLCREATFEPLREVIDIQTFQLEQSRAITIDDFIKATTQIRKSVSNNDLIIYENFNKEFGSVHY